MTVKPGVVPSTGWGRVKPGSVGQVTGIDESENTLRIRFPEQAVWWGRPVDMQTAIAPARCIAEDLKPGGE